jgi:anti-sigma factor RsiW
MNGESMNPISDEDLILYHYRDGLDNARLVEIAAALDRSDDLRLRYASIERTLARVDALPEPTPDADFNARLWRNLEPRLQPIAAARRVTWREHVRSLAAWLTPPRLAFAGAACALALAVLIGFYAGRQSAPQTPAVASAQADAAAARVLDAYVAAHLRATEGVLMTASNSDSSTLVDSNRELAASLVESNRLYALAAARTGNTQLADFLRQLEPILISLANPTPSPSIEPAQGLRDYLRSTDLLFQVRATEARLDKPAPRKT